MQAKAQRIRRYEKRETQYSHDKMLKEDTKNFTETWALLFCIAIIPLTNGLNRTVCGYQVQGTERKVSHFLYWDDLKLLGRNENDLNNGIKIVQTISKNINMNFF